jgi:hypothetical protein
MRPAGREKRKVERPAVPTKRLMTEVLVGIE